MKKIILILLLITTSAFGQVYFSGTRQPYDSGADSLILRMETATGKTMTTAGKTMISDMFKMYKDSLSINSLQNFFDVIYVFDTSDTNTLKLNWVKNAHNITIVNKAGLVYDTTGVRNTSNCVFRTNYTPSTEAVNHTLNLASIGIYIKSDVVENKYDFGAWGVNSAVTRLYARSIGNGNYYGINQNGSGQANVITSSIAFWILNRTANNVVKLYRNTDSIHYSSDVATNLPDVQIFIFDLNNKGGASGSYSTKLFSFFFIAKTLTATEIRKIYNIQRYWANNKNSITFFNP